MSQTPNPEEAIVDALLGMPDEERASYLTQACGSDAPLRRLVEGMLKAHEQAEALLKAQASPVRGEVKSPSVPMSKKHGNRIGRYKLHEQLGEGGCGVVYLAEQSEPVRRRVALKVIKLGMDTKQVIARFEAERQALALMDHPNIAKVFDGGVTETGGPFFVMELVKGIPITRFCDEHKLNTNQRLELFVQVCQAIQHAHQKEIIHRDIKPSNILVFERDGMIVPKVIDFGIAKATAGQTLTDKTLFTAFEQFIGTPAYMSPEQAHLTVEEIDTRSDVYSLGVLLYELLTGRTPFDPKRLGQSSLDEVRRIIREEDPVKPSTRLSALDPAEQTTVAKFRQSEPPRLTSLLKGDLDWIVMKTLEKDRNRRYETANGLAADIQRFRDNKPIFARPPGKLYRFGKLARRHKLAFAAGAAVLLALLIAGGALAFALHLTRQRKMPLAPDIKKIAILPFANASSDQIPPYISESLSAEIVSALQTLPGIKAFRAPDFLTAESTDQVSSALRQVDVPLLMEGSVEGNNGKIIVTGRLIETGAGDELVSMNYQRELTNLLGVPNDLALQIAEHSIGPLSDTMRNQVKREPTRSAEAYDSYLRGKYELLGQLTRPGVGSNAIPMLERAVALDDQFALAYAALSRACVSEYFYLKPEQTHDLELKAAKSFERALDLAPNLAEAHFAKGYFFWTPSQHWQVDTAIKEERVALDLSPQSQEISDHLTLIYLHLGLFQNAALLAAHAARSYPLHPLTHFLEANALFWQGQDADAARIWQSIPNALGANFVMHSYQAVALMNLGRTNEAANLIVDALRTDPSDPGGLFTSVQAILLARQGDKAGASQKIAAVSRQRNGFGLFPHALYNIAAAFALLDEPENATKFLREAAANGFPCYPFFKVDVNLNHLRSRDDFNKFLAEQQKLHEVFEAKFKERSSSGG